MRALILDASIALSWRLPDAATESTVAVQAELPEAEGVWVPSHGHLEIGNSLWMAQRWKRLDAAEVAQVVSVLAPLPALVDPGTHEHANGATLCLVATPRGLLAAPLGFQCNPFTAHALARSKARSTAR